MSLEVPNRSPTSHAAGSTEKTKPEALPLRTSTSTGKSTQQTMNVDQQFDLKQQVSVAMKHLSEEKKGSKQHASAAAKAVKASLAHEPNPKAKAKARGKKKVEKEEGDNTPPEDPEEQEEQEQDTRAQAKAKSAPKARAKGKAKAHPAKAKAKAKARSSKKPSKKAWLHVKHLV